MDTQFDFVYRHERDLAERIWLTQPTGRGVVRDFTWREAMAEVRRMAAHLRAQDYPPGSRIAILSKNCAWWFLADLAIFMAGHVSVPIYPTLNGRQPPPDPGSQRREARLRREARWALRDGARHPGRCRPNRVSALAGNRCPRLG